MHALRRSLINVPRLAIVSALAALILALPLPAGAQSAMPLSGGVSGQVHHVARAGDVIYVAGSFGHAGLSTGSLTPVDPRNGAPIGPHPRVSGIVRAMISDGAGGWYVGGDFNGLEGHDRPNVAHVRADGTVSPFRADVRDEHGYYHPQNPNRLGNVDALALYRGVLYVGGRFMEIGGVPRTGLAALDARTGALLDVDFGCDGHVAALEVRGDVLYVGGGFTTLAGASRRGAGAFHLGTRSLTAWAPDADRWVLAIAFTGHTAVLGGDFGSVHGLPRNLVAQVDLDTGIPTDWHPHLEPHYRIVSTGTYVWPYVAALEVHGRTLYLGGAFSSVRGTPRSALAAVDLETGDLTDLDPTPLTGVVKALERRGHTLYVGGLLSYVGGEHRPNAGAIDLRTGRATAWAPRPLGEVSVLVNSAEQVYVGGDYLLLYEWEERTGLAAFDALTGGLLPWDPIRVPHDFNDIEQMIGAGNTLYLAGSFQTLDGQPRRGLAAYDATSGALLPWAPETDFPPYEMDESAGTLYLAGEFSSVSGQSRHRLAAVDATTGNVLPWDPNPRGGYPSVTGTISAIDATEQGIFVGGEFDYIGGVPRRDLAALHPVTGTTLPWDTRPGFDPTRRIDYPFWIYAISGHDDVVYAGGWFLRAMGEDRRSLASFDATGAMRPLHVDLDAASWTYGRSPGVHAMERAGDHLYVAGFYEEIAGETRRDLAVLDAPSGAVLPWDPAVRPMYRVPLGLADLAKSGDALYVGGSMRGLGYYPAPGFGAISLATPRARAEQRLDTGSTTDALPLAIDLNGPQPARGATALRLTLPSEGRVRVSVLDVSGREMLRALDAWRIAGTHHVSLDLSVLAPGVYWARVEHGGRRAATRMVVMH